MYIITQTNKFRTIEVNAIHYEENQRNDETKKRRLVFTK